MSVETGLAALQQLSLEGKVAVALLLVILAALFSQGGKDKENLLSVPVDYFKPKRRLAGKDQLLLDMLNPKLNNFVITDPSLPDNPICYASDSFCKFMGYEKKEVEGRNCRFLQGKDTKPADILKIRDAIYDMREENVNLLNYKKDGTTFVNQFFISPLRGESDGKPVYFIGVQHEVKSSAPGQQFSNEGWVYTFGSHT